MPILSATNYPDMPPIQINSEGILHLLLNLKPNKAPGPDTIPARLLKELAYEFAPVLAVIYEAILEQGCLPAGWKNANIVPIFKKNNRSCPLNYRPVSLTSICCKLLEHMLFALIFLTICKSIMFYNMIFALAIPVRLSSYLLCDLACNLNSGLQTDLLLLDFKKVFDKVPHYRLLHAFSL